MKRMTRFNRWLVKLIRLTAWPLILLVLIYFATGFMMTGRYGLGGLVPAEKALAIHQGLHGALVAVVLLHSLAGIYLAFRRWGWIRKQ